MKKSKIMKFTMLVALSVLTVFLFTACTDAPDDVEIFLTPEPIEEPAPTPEAVDEDEEPAPDPEVVEEYEEEPIVNSDIHGAITRFTYGDNVVYLFGSIHGGRPEWYPLAYVVEEALDRADVLASEIGNVSPEEMNTIAMEFILLPDGQTWVEFLPEEAYDHLVDTIAAWQISYEDVNTLHPAFLIQTLELELAQALTENFTIGGFAGDVSVDGYVMGRALERNIPIIGLEPVEQQMQILYDPPMDVLVSQILYFQSPEETMAYMEYMGTLDDMATWYETNDFESFLRQSRDEIGPQHESIFADYIRETLMNWRSTYYANEIARLLQETEEPTTFFVVVGLSHVIRSGAGEGFTDIVEQLELLGFDAVPLWQ